jgi:hypothetical protein
MFFLYPSAGQTQSCSDLFASTTTSENAFKVLNEKYMFVPYANINRRLVDLIFPDFSGIKYLQIYISSGKLVIKANGIDVGYFNAFDLGNLRVHTSKDPEGRIRESVEIFNNEGQAYRFLGISKKDGIPEGMIVQKKSSQVTPYKVVLATQSFKLPFRYHSSL